MSGQGKLGILGDLLRDKSAELKNDANKDDLAVPAEENSQKELTKQDIEKELAAALSKKAETASQPDHSSQSNFASHLPSSGYTPGAGGYKGIANDIEKNSGGTRGNRFLAVIFIILSVLAGIFFFYASNIGSISGILPFAIFIIAFMLFMVSGKKHPFAVIFIIVNLLAVWFLSRTPASLSLSVLFPLGFFILASLIFIAGDRLEGSAATAGFVAAWVLIIFGMIFFYLNTSSHFVFAFDSGKVSDVGEDIASSSSQSIKSLIDDAVLSYNRQKSIVSGDYLTGTVDNTVKEDAGIELLSPYLLNPGKITDKEISALEISARVKVHDPKTEVFIGTACNMQTEKRASELSRTLSGSFRGPDLDSGSVQTHRPESFSGFSFEKEFTCYPRPDGCGDYVITLSAEADNLRTDARFFNYVIDRKVLESSLQAYAESKGNVFRSESDVMSAIRLLYPEVETSPSISDKGSIMVLMMTEKFPLIGIEPNTELNFRIGVENRKDGWILRINSIEVEIADYFMPLQGFCENWEFSEGKLTLSKDYLSNVDFNSVTKNTQKIFPSCRLVPSSGVVISEPIKSSFIASVDYDYIVQKKFKVKVTNSTGKDCIRKDMEVVVA